MRLYDHGGLVPIQQHTITSHPDRVILAMLLVVAMGGSFLLENPSGTIVNMHDSFVWFTDLLRAFAYYASPLVIPHQC